MIRVGDTVIVVIRVILKIEFSEHLWPDETFVGSYLHNLCIESLAKYHLKY